MQASVSLAGGPESVALDIASEPFFEDPVERAERDRRAVRRLAIAMGMAILFHTLIAVVTVVAPDWWRRAEPPKAIPITLVAEPPPPPPPPPPPAEKPRAPKPEPPLPAYARSGPDERMASPPREQAPPVPSPMPPAGSPAAEPTPSPATAPPEPTKSPAAQKPIPAPEAVKPVPLPLPQPKPATPKTAPRPKPGPASNGPPPGPREMTGNVYLNMVWAKIHRNYRYPDAFRRDGLVGSVVFSMTLSRSGEIIGLDKINSSGNSAIDLYAEELIRRASPVPPPPPSIPGDTLNLTVVLNVGPAT